jgi:phycocyanobilin:ferredoxin oxidoreductase
LGTALSPVQADRTLPSTYHQALSSLPNLPFSQTRELPIWGNIFSTHFIFVRPVDHSEKDYFLQRTQQLLTIHCNIATQTYSVISRNEKALIVAGQRYYCHRQRENDKTRQILEKSFGTDWTERYMSTILFDCAAA